MKVLEDYTIQRGYALKKIYNERRGIKIVYRLTSCPFQRYATMMVDE